MWMDDLRRNMDRKAKADALPDEIRKAHREQYRNVCRDAVKACIIGMAEVMTGKPQERTACGMCRQDRGRMDAQLRERSDYTYP